VFFLYTNVTEDKIYEETLTFSIMKNMKQVSYDDKGFCSTSDSKEYKIFIRPKSKEILTFVIDSTENGKHDFDFKSDSKMTKCVSDSYLIE